MTLIPPREPGFARLRPEGGVPEVAYREIAMWEILEVLRRVHRREPRRA
jgi:hypothetical protein